MLIVKKQLQKSVICSVKGHFVMCEGDCSGLTVVSRSAGLDRTELLIS